MRQFHLLKAGIFLVILGLTFSGCSSSLISEPITTPDTQLTQIALKVQILENQLEQVAPTLTAFVLANKTSATKASISAPVVTETALPSPLPTRTPTPRTIPTLQATIDAAQVTSQAGLLLFTQAPGSSDKTSTPPAFLRNGSLKLPSATSFSPESQVLFADDFSREIGWFTKDSERFVLEFTDGGYRVFVMTKNNPVWSARTQLFEDVRLEVDAVQTKGPVDGYFGLICRQVDSENYYMLVVGMDGAFGIAKVKDGSIRYLNYTNDYPTLLRLTGNRLRGDCIGDRLAMYVDGTKVLEASDDEFIVGGAGVVAGNRSTSGTDVFFDNFIVIKPEQ